MLFRFCLYGFLKNQQYYDIFFVLAFLEKGLSYTMIGTLIGFREICVSLMEIPTGAVADVLGRRRSMIASFLAYIASFALFGAYIGPFTSIQKDCRIRRTEIENSIILEGSRILDVGARVDESLIGRGVAISKCPPQPSVYRFMVGDQSEILIR